MTRTALTLSRYFIVWLTLFVSVEAAEIRERHYAPDRKVDILHIKIDVTPDFKARTVAGTTTISFTPIAKPHAARSERSLEEAPGTERDRSRGDTIAS
ncbi:hypothetical protein ACFL60_02310 [Candidatus Omnitrophota bacterium]